MKRRQRWKVLAVVGLVVVASLAGLWIAHTINVSEPPGRSPAPAGAVVDRLQLGATLTQQTPLTETLPAALLDKSVGIVGVSLSGNGTDDPEPSPGVFDWSSLDSRMRQLQSVHASIMMRVFEAPPWMTGGVPKGAVRPRFYHAFAELVLDSAERYPMIHYFAIWNELMGYRSDPSHWNYVAYTRLYNVVYSTLKGFNPSLNIGGPYAPFPPASVHSRESTIVGPWGALDQNSLDTVTYWLAHKAGADFIAVDGRTAFPSAVPSDPVGATTMFAAVDSWIEHQTTLPIWWTEWYARSPKLGSAEWNALSAYALIQLAYSGASSALIWDSEFEPGRSTATPGLWTAGTQTGTALTPVFNVLRGEMIGTEVRLWSPVAGVEELTNPGHFVAIDLTGQGRRISVLGRTVELPPYGIVTG